ncbi:LysR family transcriptional regulator [Mangrovimicrobium sediminis]|uniref:LysR family transcriptional regulator n=1 Tax=Mangrovimicrobium sediminis TaxID=2562682 RepID=A0A4Z0M711_9GAMM|nr:LysR family transcriptional regulator [Haliea sp. SAOS-164]TGD75311.1 LysR family transcriptional regulator [Haliea sp. SAOS-164]
MRLDRIDLNLFVVFEAVYRERSVTRVAQELHLTQPAVSNALGRLRQAFADQLFVRTPQGMQPTPVADNVIGDVRRALLLLQDSIGVGAQFDPQSSEKVFRLAVNDLLLTLLLPVLHRRLLPEAPGVVLQAFYPGREAAVAELKAGDIDLLVDSPQINARELGQAPLACLPYVVAMRPGHPLASSPLTLDAYLGADHLHVSGRPRGRGHVDIALHALGRRRQVKVRLQHHAPAAALTADSDLLWTTTELAARNSGLHCVPPPFAVEPLALNLYYSRSAAEDPANRWLREHCLAAVAAGALQAA